MAAERFLIIENRLMAVEGTMDDFTKKVDGLTEQLANVQSTVLGLGDGVQQLGADVTAYAGTLASEKAKFTEDVNHAFDDQKVALVQVVNAAREEFLNIKGGLTDLHSQTASAFLEVKSRVELLETEIRVGKRMWPTTWTRSRRA